LLRGTVSVIRRKDTNIFYQNRIQTLRNLDEPETPEKGLTSSQAAMDALIAEMGVKVKEIKEGEGFGEKALLEKFSLRTASILTNVNCEFIVIMKDDYVNTISRFDSRRHAKMEFMKNHIPSLDSLASLEIWDDLFYLIKEQESCKESVVISESQIGSNIFFVASGQCALTKTFTVQLKKGYSDYEPTEITRTVATIGSGSCFGEEILQSRGTKYKYTITVKSSSAHFYSIDRTQFLMRFPPECVKIIQSNFFLKEKVHRNRMCELEKEAEEADLKKYKSTINFRNKDVLELLGPQYRNKMTQHAYLTQKRNLTFSAHVKQRKEVQSFLEMSRDYKAIQKSIFNNNQTTMRSFEITDTLLERIPSHKDNQNILNELNDSSHHLPPANLPRPKTDAKHKTQERSPRSPRSPKIFTGGRAKQKLLTVNVTESSFSKAVSEHQQQQQQQPGHTQTEPDNDPSPRVWMNDVSKNLFQKLNRIQSIRHLNPGKTLHIPPLDIRNKDTKEGEGEQRPSLDALESSKITLEKFDFGPSSNSPDKSRPRKFLGSPLNTTTATNSPYFRFDISPSIPNSASAQIRCLTDTRKEEESGVTMNKILARMKASRDSPTVIKKIESALIKRHSKKKESTIQERSEKKKKSLIFVRSISPAFRNHSIINDSQDLSTTNNFKSVLYDGQRSTSRHPTIFKDSSSPITLARVQSVQKVINIPPELPRKNTTLNKIDLVFKAKTFAMKKLHEQETRRKRKRKQPEFIGVS